MKVSKLFTSVIFTLCFASLLIFNNYKYAYANSSVEHKVESIFKRGWHTKLNSYSKPTKVAYGQKTAYYHSYGIGGKYSFGPTYRVGNLYFDKNKKVIAWDSVEQSGYGTPKYTKLGKNYYMVSNLESGIDGSNSQKQNIIGFNLFIKLHGRNKMTLSQKYTGVGKTYPSDLDQPHTYYRM